MWQLSLLFVTGHSCFTLVVRVCLSIIYIFYLFIFRSRLVKLDKYDGYMRSLPVFHPGHDSVLKFQPNKIHLNMYGHTFAYIL